MRRRTCLNAANAEEDCVLLGSSSESRLCETQVSTACTLIIARFSIFLTHFVEFCPMISSPMQHFSGAVLLRR